MFRNIFLVLSYLSTLVLLGLLALIFLWPEYLVYVKLNIVQAKLLAVFIISLLLLLNSFMSNLSVIWKILCAIFSIVVLVEFVLMNDWWQIFIK